MCISISNNNIETYIGNCTTSKKVQQSVKEMINHKATGPDRKGVDLLKYGSIMLGAENIALI